MYHVAEELAYGKIDVTNTAAAIRSFMTDCLLSLEVSLKDLLTRSNKENDD